MAIVHLSYTSTAGHLKVKADVDTATTSPTTITPTGLPPPYVIGPISTANPGDTIYNFLSFFNILAIPAYPYFIEQDTDHTTFITSVDESVHGQITVNNNGIGSPFQFRMISWDGTIDRGWQASNVFTGVVQNRYIVLGRQTGSPWYLDFVNITVYPTLVANISETDTSSPGGSDGLVAVNVTAGSGNYTVTWWDATTSTSTSPEIVTIAKTGVSAGTYAVTLTDNLSGQTLPFSVTVNDPVIIVNQNSNFFVPKTQSLTFVQEVTPDDCTIFQTLDNVRFCKQQFAKDHTPGSYSQKVCFCDNFPIQWQSNYNAHLVQVLSSVDNSVIDILPAVLKIQNIGVPETFLVTIKDNGSGQSRVYFTGVPLFPILLNIGDIFSISANADGFNGTYQIITIDVDLVSGSQYLVINKAYAIIPSSSAGTGVFFVTVVDFNIFESPIDFSKYPRGNYYISIQAINTIDPTKNPLPALSEPIYLAQSHQETNIIKFKNVDNAFDMNFQTGIVCQRRLVSRLFKRNPGGKMDTIRNTTGALRKIRAIPERHLTFEITMQPPYIHELLSVIMSVGVDCFWINGVPFQSDQAYANPNYLFNFGLASTTMEVEQVDWFKTYNSNNLNNANFFDVGIPMLWDDGTPIYWDDNSPVLWDG